MPSHHARRWRHADELGSIVALSSDAGGATSINTYDEYGVPEGTLSGRFGYTGQVWLPTIDIYYYRNRLYHPVLGRFMQTDPIGYAGGMNLYAYVGNDPVNATDPLGLQNEDPDKGDKDSEGPPIVITAPHWCIPIPASAYRHSVSILFQDRGRTRQTG